MKTEITLGEVAEHLEMIEIGCRKCDRYARLSVGRLIEEYGAHQAMRGLLSTFAADCPRQRAPSIYARCGAYWKFHHDDALRIVLLIIILAALALFGLTTPPIWVVSLCPAQSLIIAGERLGWTFPASVSRR